ncbi:MBL fold metallo-hydrolase [candidate division KSB1 bacterium]|nr:MBL fold metallo-hydrolase [candidate division KSB1 bacterium]NIR72771.1 MBL fold metallo-hydrolase [candidate division KSB1 bacterium]NIS23727.1 MBL fold metallo-hydrolase [candidate division KSB1 bacterium]NIT70647.1 MBL fold metallo-hydrolase [candidate division KSB1 bacterium]NIU24375.1 MBL fold metallo-hydrolase [candidate division KSB1 bacterium]
MAFDKKKRSEEKGPGARLTVVYDNNSMVGRLQTGKGFACLVEVGERTVLFNTGRQSDVLLNNMRALGIDPLEIESVLISNVHQDHLGGLTGFLECNPSVTVYVPESAPKELTANIEKAGAKSPIRVSSPMELCPDLFTLGELKSFFDEQVLAIQTSPGLILVTGCARPGIKSIWQQARSLFPDESIYLVLGGFHLGRLKDLEIAKTVDDFLKLEIKKVAPCHCSGQDARRFFEKAYGENFIRIGVGSVVEIC